MAKRKPTAARVLALVQNALDYGESAAAWRRKIASNDGQTGMTTARLEELAASDIAGADECMKSAARLVRSLPPDELAELLSEAPGWFRTLLVQVIEKIPPVAPCRRYPSGPRSKCRQSRRPFRLSPCSNLPESRATSLKPPAPSPTWSS